MEEGGGGGGDWNMYLVSLLYCCVHYQAAKRARTMADISCCHGAEDVSPISVSATPTQLGSFEELCSNIGHVEVRDTLSLSCYWPCGGKGHP